MSSVVYPTYICEAGLISSPFSAGVLFLCHTHDENSTCNMVQSQRQTFGAIWLLSVLFKIN